MSRNWDEYNLVEKKILDLFAKLGYIVYDVSQGDKLTDRESNSESLAVSGGHYSKLQKSGSGGELTENN